MHIFTVRHESWKSSICQTSSPVCDRGSRVCQRTSASGRLPGLRSDQSSKPAKFRQKNMVFIDVNDKHCVGLFLCHNDHQSQLFSTWRGERVPCRTPARSELVMVTDTSGVLRENHCKRLPIFGYQHYYMREDNCKTLQTNIGYHHYHMRDGYYKRPSQ